MLNTNLTKIVLSTGKNPTLNFNSDNMFTCVFLVFLFVAVHKNLNYYK